MRTSGVIVQGYLVVDNNFLAMLTNYYCDTHKSQFPGRSLIKKTGQWISDQLNILRALTPDKRIHCTDWVAAEYRPAASHLRLVLGPDERVYQNLAAGVCSCLDQSQIDSGDLAFLRELPTAPRKLIGAGGVSDADLSLVALGFNLSHKGERVYILSNDQDLLTFSSWALKNVELRQRWANAQLLQAFQSLHYLDEVHRNCHIATDDMRQLLHYFMIEHVAREDLGKSKKMAIFRQLIEISESLIQSAQIKAQSKGSNV